MMVATAHDLATQAGWEVLKKGGNAFDAAVAVSFVISVTHSYHTGIGGGGFALIREAKTGKVHALDFREKAPAAARRDMFLREGELQPSLSTDGPLAVAVPGLVAGIIEIYDRFGSGTMTLSQLLEPAIRVAEDGFPVTPDIALAIQSRAQVLAQYPESAQIYLPGGRPLQEGERLVQKDLGKTLRKIADQGAAGFYRGPVAKAIVTGVKRHGGILTLEDLARYQVKERRPIAGTYRNYQLFLMPPPSSGGVHIAQMLNILEGDSLKEPQSAETFHLLAETFRRAYRDRALFLGDPDFVSIPVERLTSKEYARELRESIQETVLPLPEESPSTTHFSVVDREGNIVASTQTINLYFGSGLVAAGTGILLNNEMDDFSSQPGAPNAFGLVGGAANAIEPNKRPLSSMSPTIVLDPTGQPFAILGAAGGSRIITSVLQALVNLIDFHLPPPEAIAAARVHQQWKPPVTEIETARLLDQIGPALKKRGHQIQPMDPVRLANVHAIVRWNRQWVGVADPRGEGTARGE